ADVVSIDGPDTAPAATRVHFTIVVANSGQVDWPAATQLRLAAGATSPLHDVSWASPTVITTLGSAVAAGKQGTLDFDVTTPAVDVDTPVSQVLVLDDAGTKFGTINLALTVVPGMTEPTSGDGSEGET